MTIGRFFALTLPDRFELSSKGVEEMNKLFFTIGIVLTFSISSFSQKEAPSASAGGHGGGSIQANNVIAIEGQLEKTLDVKHAQVGDQVVIKTTRAVKEAGATIVPKGSRLVGRITEVQQRMKGNDLSRLGFVFDRIEGTGLNSDLSGSVITITSIMAPAGPVSEPVDLFGSSSTSSRASASSSGSTSGSGLLGGATSAAGGLVGGVTNTAGSTLNSGLQTVSSATGTAVQTVGSTAGGIVQNINGLQISNSAEGSAQAGTTLSSAGKDLKVEKGATVKLQLNGNTKGQ